MKSADNDLFFVRRWCPRVCVWRFPGLHGSAGRLGTQGLRCRGILWRVGNNQLCCENVAVYWSACTIPQSAITYTNLGLTSVLGSTKVLCWSPSVNLWMSRKRWCPFVSEASVTKNNEPVTNSAVVSKTGKHFKGKRLARWKANVYTFPRFYVHKGAGHRHEFRIEH